MSDFDTRLILRALELRLSECSEDGKIKVQRVMESISSLEEIDFPNPFPYSSDEFRIAKEALDNLERICKPYTSLELETGHDLEKLKMQMGGYLGSFTPHVEVLYRVSQDYEDWVKKVTRERLATEIQNSQSISKAKALTLVESSPIYLKILQGKQEYVRVVSYLRSKSDFYNKLWQMVMQSVSSAKKHPNTQR